MGSVLLSRRSFVAVTGAAIVGAASATTAKADLHYRLGLSQPLDSPNFIRLKEMAEGVRTESNGRMLIDVMGAGALGSDSAMLAMLQKNELEMYLGGNVFGPIVPTMELPGLPFTSRPLPVYSPRSMASLATISAARCWTRASIPSATGWITASITSPPAPSPSAQWTTSPA
jgi:hypothetical protein